MKTAKSWYILCSVLTVVVVFLVGLMDRVTIPTPEWWDVSFLPGVNAIINTLVAVCIIAGGVAIKQGKKQAHRKLMISAFSLSAIFLLSYVAYHFTSGHTYYGDANHDGVLSEAEALAAQGSKSIYIVILLSHIGLSIVSFPLILFSIVAASFAQFSLHKKLTKWAFPMWLYVAITGPIVYLMISPFYG